MTLESNERGVTRRAILRLLALSASPLTAACEGGAPNRSKEPIRSKGPMLVTNPDPRTPFLLDFIGSTFPNYGELRIEDGKTTTLRETMTWTRLRSDVSGFIASSAAPVDGDVTGFVPPVFEDDALAVHVVSPRSWDKLPNEVIGLYACRVESDDLQALRRAIEETPWASLPRPTGGEYRDVTVVIRYVRGDVLIERKCMLGSHEFIEAIESVWKRIANIESKVQPLATLEIQARVQQTSDESPRCSLYVTLKNRGTQPVVFTDPRIPFGDHRAFDIPSDAEGELLASLQTKARIIVEVCPEDKVYMPMRGAYVPLPPLPEDAPQTVVLRGGSKFELEIPWVAPAPGPYWLRARWLDYDGPIEPAKGQLPFMPIPEQGPALIGTGPYPIRGTIFAEGPFEVPV